MRALVVAGLAIGGLVIVGATASAAPAYQLIAVDAGGTALAGATTFATASGDGSVVAFSQQDGDGCADHSALWVRNRQAASTAGVGDGHFPSISRTGTLVAFVACDGNVAVWQGAVPAKPLPAGNSRRPGTDDTIKSLAVAPDGAHAVFTVGSAAGAVPASLWVVPTDGSAPPAQVAGQGQLDGVAISDKKVFFVAGAKLQSADVVQPAAVTPFPVEPDGAPVKVSVSADGRTVVTVTSDGKAAVSLDKQAFVAVTDKALEPSVAPDGSAVALKMTADSSIRTFSTGAAPAVLSTATPLAAVGFSAPVAADGGREVVFLANPGQAAGGTSTAAQVYGIGPGLSTAPVNFGDVGLGTTTTKAVTFTNDGTATITPTSVTSSNAGEFAIVAGTTCAIGAPIAVTESCVVQVALTPTAAGARSSTITVAELGTRWDEPAATANLTATAVNGELAADPTSITFGSVTIGSSSSARSFTVTNSGVLPTTIGTLLVSGGQASEFPLAGGTCAGATLQPAGDCTVLVSFKPGGTGTRSASLDVGGSAGAAVSVALSGTGTDPPRPALAVSPTALEFGELVIGSAAAPQSVTVRNSGNVSNSPNVQLGGAAAGDFLISNNGCAGHSISAGATCTVSVEFVPIEAGARGATLSITGSGGSSASVRLSGTGRLNPVMTVSPGVVVPGEITTVVGTNFPDGAAVVLAWDVGGLTVGAVADDTGSFSVAMVVPTSMGGGTRTVVVIAPADASTATASVLVQETGGFQAPAGPAFRASPAFPSSG